MASDVKRGKGYTAPKGRPTVHPTAGNTSRRMSSTMEWLVAGIVFLLVLAAIFYFGRDFSSPAGTTGEPADAPVVQLFAPDTA